ncbi:uncharacterized protein LOC110271968 [Arachis ipaensis]|uniref:uncharacterized protein LOC110271968 n=1 Tax=Arachis ipaensis TaxID=130454 RepID=UPI000A2B7881|nr:uncharacterized protein LOC110271968 [Arachis ipaensis]
MVTIAMRLIVNKREKRARRKQGTQREAGEEERCGLAPAGLSSPPSCSPLAAITRTRTEQGGRSHAAEERRRGAHGIAATHGAVGCAQSPSGSPRLRPVPGANSCASVTRGGARPTAQSCAAVCYRRRLGLMPPSSFEEREGGCGEDEARWWFVLPPLLPSPSGTATRAATKDSERQRARGGGRARRCCAMEQSEPRRRY